MKRWLVWMAVLLLLLSGCDAQPQGETTQSVETTAVQQTLPSDPGCYEPGSETETLTGGAVRAYAPEGACIGIGYMGQELLVFSAEEENTRVTRLTGDTGAREATAVLSGSVCPENANVWTRSNVMAYYLEAENSLVLLDESLQEMDRFPLSGEPVGAMTMDKELTTLYYGTASELRALDTQTGISRLVRQHSCQEQGVLQSLLDDSVLMCYVVQENGHSGMEFISTQNGQILQDDDTLHRLDMWQESWFAVHTDGSVTELLYALAGAEPRLWLPAETDAVFYNALSMGGMVAVSNAESGVTLTLYDLAEGSRKASVTLNVDAVEHVVADEAGEYIWFLSRDDGKGADTLCRWEPSASPVRDSTNYTTVRYTRENPDTEGLAHCRAQADALEEQYGIELCLDDTAVLPEGYFFVWEYQVEAIRQGLEDLERALAKFPEGFFKTVAKVSDSRVFSISLVRELYSSSGLAVEDETGLQYWVDGDAYVALAMGEDTERTFYHELSHVLETYVFTKTSVYDTWETLNPEGFHYDENYTDYLRHQDSPYLQGENRAFIDAFSMTYVREDRARVLEYALTDGNAEYFQSEIMQAKLEKLCQGIRRAFKWRKDPREFPWEQYLNTSLAYVEE